MAVAQHDSFLPSKEFGVEREVKENGRPPPFHIASLLSTSPRPEKRDNSCGGSVHHKPVPGPSGSGDVLGASVDYSYPCQCGDAGKPHSARRANCKYYHFVAHRDFKICSYFFTHLPVCSCNTSTYFLIYTHFFRPVMQLCVLPRSKFSHISDSPTSPHPCQSHLLPSFDLSRSLPASKWTYSHTSGSSYCWGTWERPALHSCRSIST